MDSPNHKDLRSNRLFALLPPDDRDFLAAGASVGAFPRGEALIVTGEEVGRVWLPLDCVVSLTVPLRDGGAAEAATVGREGVAGLAAALGSRLATANAVVQVAGRAAGLDAARLRAAFVERPAVRELCLRCQEALIGQLLQSAACNAMHTTEARLARWLLMVQDRCAGAEVLPLTQEFLAEMLGVHRPTVTVVARTLQAAGLISYQRGHVRVLDRPGLEGAACVCYGAIRRLLERLLPDAGLEGTGSDSTVPDRQMAKRSP